MTENKKRGRPPKIKPDDIEAQLVEAEKKLARKNVEVNSLVRKGVIKSDEPLTHEEKFTPFEPTKEQADIVYEYTLRGVHQQLINQKIINPATKRPIDDMTFKKHFGHIEKEAHADRMYMLGDKLWNSTDTTALIFLAKCAGLNTREAIDKLLLDRERLQFDRDKWLEELNFRREQNKTAPPEITIKWGDDNS